MSGQWMQVVLSARWIGLTRSRRHGDDTSDHNAAPLDSASAPAVSSMISVVISFWRS